jgi:hypothetical protein
LLASSAALSLVQNAAWAACSDGTTFPAGGFVIGSPQVPAAANWSHNVFISAAGSVFIPDTSVNEANDPTKTLTGGGHNWVFDQGSTLCKQIDVGSAGTPATAWASPNINSNGCILLPIVNNNGIIVSPGDIVIQGGAITPTCDPAILASANNTYFNQLGCSISHGVARDAQHATTYLFVVGGKGRLIMVALDNVPNPRVGGDAGKEVSNFGFYTAIPSGQTFTNAAISPDGRFAMASSDKKLQTVFACLNPLGDPGDPTKPINPNFTIPAFPTVPVGQPLPATVPCMQVGNNNLVVKV